jgi:hypothetical protein
MKKILRYFLFVSVLAGALLLTHGVNAQAPPPPDPPGSHGSGTNQSPMGAPIDGGLTVFLTFAAIYCGHVWYQKSNKLAK